MSKERIDIVISEERLAADAEHGRLLDAALKGQKPARTPVVLNVDEWFSLFARGQKVSDYLSSPRQNLLGQLLNLKYRLENIDDDMPLPSEGVVVQPDFGSIRGTQFPLVWHATEAGPWVCDPLLTEPEQIDSLSIPDPSGGLHSKKTAWFREMQQLAGDFELRLNSKPLNIRVNIGHSGGPIPCAFALAGERLFEWMACEPQRTHRLMDIVTQSQIQCTRFYHEMAGRKPDAPIWTGADAAEMISPDMFREFVVPYYLRVWTAFPGTRTFHMCGRINHLLDILRDEMKINVLDGFGFPVPPELLAQKMIGRVVLKGGFSPVLVHSGPVAEIQTQTRHYMDLLAQQGGFIMSVGGGAVAGTPPQHFQALIDTARSWTPAA